MHRVRLASPDNYIFEDLNRDSAIRESGNARNVPAVLRRHSKRDQLTFSPSLQ